MNKFIKFNSILFSSVFFLLNPILGMDNDPVLTKSKSKKPREFIWTLCIDNVDPDNKGKSSSTPESSAFSSSSSSSSSSSTSSHKNKSSFNWTNDYDDYTKPTDYVELKDFSAIIANDPTYILPDEILLKIFREVLLSIDYIKDFNSLARVNRNWHRIWQDNTLQKALLQKIRKNTLFEKEINTFKKTRNPRDLDNIYKQLKKDDYNNVTLIQLLCKNNIKIKDVIPDFDKFNILKQFTILIKFKDKKGIEQFIDFCSKNMGVGCLATILNTQVDSHGRTLPLCAISFIDCTDNLTSLIPLFVKCGADLSIPDLYGRNALHYAVQKGNVKVLCALLLEFIINNRSQQLMAMLSFKNRANETPRKLAKKLFKEIIYKMDATKKPTGLQKAELTKRKKILIWILRTMVNPNNDQLFTDLNDYVNPDGW